MLFSTEELLLHSLGHVCEEFLRNYTPRASFSAVSITTLELDVINGFRYTSDTSFSEKCPLH